MPEPLSVIALLLFGFIAGWVVRAAVGGGSSADRSAEGGRERAPEPAIEAGAPPVPAPAPVAEPEPEPESEPAPVRATPDLSEPIAAAVAAYDDVVDDWLDDHGEVGESGQGSLERFDAALRSLEGSDGTHEGVAALRIAGDIVHERRRQPLDAATDAALRGLEPRFRG